MDAHEAARFADNLNRPVLFDEIRQYVAEHLEALALETPDIEAVARAAAKQDIPDRWLPVYAAALEEHLHHPSVRARAFVVLALCKLARDFPHLVHATLRDKVKAELTT